MEDSDKFQRVALAEAELALQKGNMPIGCVIVYDGKIISSGHNTVDSGASDLDHAELSAIKKIENLLFTSLKGKCEIYSTLEPCLMCYGAISNYRFKKIIYSMADSYAGFTQVAKLPEYYRGRKIEIVSGLFKEDAERLMRKYVEVSGHREHLLNWFS